VLFLTGGRFGIIMVMSASTNFLTQAANAMAKANKFEKKCRVEKHFGMKMPKDDLFYHIAASDLRKIEEQEIYGKSNNLVKYFFDVRV
jgi:hypothetical protein